MKQVPIDSIKQKERNPRKIGAKELERLCASIERDPEFMVLRPIVTDKQGVIIGGNQRWAACKKLGMKNLPGTWVVQAAKLTPAQRRRFVLVDNGPQGMTGEWDMKIVEADWSVPELTDLGFDIEKPKPPVKTSGLTVAKRKWSGSDPLVLVMQPAESPLCGQACVATLLSVTLAEAILILDSHKGTTADRLCKGLALCGIKMDKRASRVKYEHGSAVNLPETAIVKLRWNGSKHGHWIIFHQGEIYDPEVGAGPAYGEGVRMSSFYAIS